VKIGSTGTAISASPRAITSWTLGTLAANTGATTVITVTGAATGADCLATETSGVVAGVGGIFGCSTAANQCSVSVYNPTAVGITFGTRTVACRVFNP
jgi:hypothetical protein